MFFSSGDLFIFTSDGEIRGQENNIFRFGPASVAFTSQVYSFTVSNIFLREPSRMITKSNAPSIFCLSNTRFVFNTSYTFFSNNVVIKNFVDIRAFEGALKKLVIDGQLVLLGGSQLNIRTTNGLFVNKIISSDSISSIILDAARLVYTSTATSQYLFYNAAGTGYGRGRVIVRGQSELMVNTASSKLMVTPESAFIFESGARLKLNPSTKLVIY